RRHAPRAPLFPYTTLFRSDGAAAALIVRAEDAHRYTDTPMYVKALSFVAGPAPGATDPGYDYTTFPEVVRSAEDAYRQAGITDPDRKSTRLNSSHGSISYA